MFEQFGFFGLFKPNPNLQPETSTGWDAGVELTIAGGRATLDVTYFNQRLENKIKTTFTGAINLVEAREHPRRVSRSLRVASAAGLSLGGAYTRLEARDANGLREPRRPRNTGRVDLNYAFDGSRGNLNLAALYNGEARDDGFRVLFHAFGFPAFATESVTLDDYWLVTAAASYKVQPGVEVFGRVENLLNRKYEEASGYNTPGLAAYAGVRFTYVDRPALADAGAK